MVDVGVPDTKRGSYLLPVKKAVRSTEGISEGDEFNLTLEVIDA